MSGDTAHGWRVHAVDDFMGMTERVTLWRDAGDGMAEAITNIAANSHGTTIERIARTEEPPMLVLPVGVLAAIAEHLNPGPTHAEVAVLREALDIERARVDRLLGGAA